MSVKAAMFSALILSVLALSAPAQAFTVEQAPVNADGSPRFTDPDTQLDRLSEERQDARDQNGQANWYGGDRSSRSFGAQPRDDHSYWGSPLIENPSRQR